MRVRPPALSLTSCFMTLAWADEETRSNPHVPVVSQWQCPDPTPSTLAPGMMPACPSACSTSMNITPQQRPIVPLGRVLVPGEANGCVAVISRWVEPREFDTLLPPRFPISREPVTLGAHARHKQSRGAYHTSIPGGGASERREAPVTDAERNMIFLHCPPC